MCTTGAACPIFEHAVLARLTYALAAGPVWAGRRRPLVGRLVTLRDGVVATTVGRVIRYPDRAPVCTVAHEMAHLARGGGAHDPEWARWQHRLAQPLSHLVNDLR